MNTININLDTKTIMFSSVFSAGEHQSVVDMLQEAIDILQERIYKEAPELDTRMVLDTREDEPFDNREPEHEYPQ